MTAGGADEVTYNDYETFAADYARSNETSPFNALYERPAIIALAGDGISAVQTVSPRRISCPGSKIGSADRPTLMNNAKNNKDRGKKRMERFLVKNV